MNGEIIYCISAQRVDGYICGVQTYIQDTHHKQGILREKLAAAQT